MAQVLARAVLFDLCALIDILNLECVLPHYKLFRRFCALFSLNEEFTLICHVKGLLGAALLLLGAEGATRVALS